MKKILAIIVLSLLALTASAQTGMWVGVRGIRVEKTSKNSKYLIRAQYPMSGETVTGNAIREWISESLGGSWTGSLDDVEAMFDYYADKEIKEAIKDKITFQCTRYFSRFHETSHIITYAETGEYNSSEDAHGDAIDTKVTFRKSDGRRFTWDMFTKDGKKQLKAILAKKLRVDYGDDTFFKVPDASDPEFKLPETDPYFSEEGLVFVYPPYVIAPHAAGFITITLPLSMVKGMLNATGQTYLISVS